MTAVAGVPHSHVEEGPHTRRPPRRRRGGQGDQVRRLGLTLAALVVGVAGAPAVWAGSTPVDQQCVASRTSGAFGDTLTQTFATTKKTITAVDVNLAFVRAQTASITVRLVTVAQPPPNPAGVAGVDLRVLATKQVSVRAAAYKMVWAHVPLSPPLDVPPEVTAGAAVMGLQMVDVPGPAANGRAGSYAWMMCSRPYAGGRGLATGNVKLTTTYPTPLEVDSTYDFAFRTYGR